MTAPGMVPPPNATVADRLVALERRVRTMQQAAARATISGQVLTGAGLAGSNGAVIYTTSGSTEKDLPKLALTVPVVAGRVYLIGLYLYGHVSGATTDFLLRARLTTALTGTIAAVWNLFEASSGFDACRSYVAPWTAPSTTAQTICLSAQQTSGSSTLSVDAPSAAWIADAGTAWAYT